MKFLAVLLLVFCGISARAQSTPPDSLAPIAWMAGGTWHGEVPNPGGGAPTRIDTHIRRILGGRALAFDTSFNGKPTYEGTFAFDPSKKQIVFAYPSADGDWVSGTLAPQADFFLLDFTVAESNGTVGHFQSRMHIDGPDDYTWTLYSSGAKGWTELFHVKYHRMAA